MIHLRLPKIDDGLPEKEQLLQIKKYLYQLVEELQFELNSNSSAINIQQSPNLDDKTHN